LGIRGFEYEGVPYYEDFNVVFGSQEEKVIYPVTVLDVVEDSGAQKAYEEYDLEVPFVIKEVDDNDVESVEQLQDILEKRKGEEVEMRIEEEDGDGKDIQLQVDEEGIIGVELAADLRVWVLKYSGGQRYFAGFLHFANMSKANYFILGKLFSQSVEEGDVSPVSDSVSGPLGLLVIVDIVREFGGLIGIVDLIATLNLVLVIMNLIPIPALDGGQVLLMIIEKLRGKPMNKKLERVIVNISMILLFALMIVVSVKDFFQFGFWARIREFIKGVLSI
jgi:regulator of sigma E protease